ncbi:MAG: hypothetical protein LBR34_05245 [Prevotella sp.]|jgi:hypothetical protein|nr:hypothetical protein [Prevotella sp.]
MNRIIYNKYFPFGNYVAINLFGFIFARDEYRALSKQTLNHEHIHTRQMVELLWLFYYLAYFAEWIVRLLQYRNLPDAYKNISFEREAYRNDRNYAYLTQRRRFAFIDYYTDK